MDPLDVFHTLVGELDYPMFIVTADDGLERSGCLVGFATQASIDPPRLLVLLSRANRTCRVARGAKELVVHFLGADNLELTELFGQETGDDSDKFARCRWQPTPGGTPVLDGTRGWVGGTVAARLDLGDHVGHLVEPTAGGRGRAGRQLGFQAVRGLAPGHPA